MRILTTLIGAVALLSTSATAGEGTGTTGEQWDDSHMLTRHVIPDPLGDSDQLTGIVVDERGGRTLPTATYRPWSKGPSARVTPRRSSRGSRLQSVRPDRARGRAAARRTTARSPRRGQAGVSRNARR